MLLTGWWTSSVFVMVIKVDCILVGLVTVFPDSISFKSCASGSPVLLYYSRRSEAYPPCLVWLFLGAEKE